jgi:nucleoid-associated protein YgaU
MPLDGPPIHPVTGEPLAPPDGEPSEPRRPGPAARLLGRLRKRRPVESPDDEALDGDEAPEAGEPHRPRGSFFRRFWTRPDAGADPAEDLDSDVPLGDHAPEELESLDEAPARRWKLSRRGRIGLAVGISAVVLGSVGVAKWSSSGSAPQDEAAPVLAAKPSNPPPESRTKAPAVASTASPDQKALGSTTPPAPVEESSPATASSEPDLTAAPPSVAAAPPAEIDPAGALPPLIGDNTSFAPEADIPTPTPAESLDAYEPPALPTASNDPFLMESPSLDAPPPATASATLALDARSGVSIPEPDSIPPLGSSPDDVPPNEEPIGIAGLTPIPSDDSGPAAAVPPLGNLAMGTDASPVDPLESDPTPPPAELPPPDEPTTLGSTDRLSAGLTSSEPVAAAAVPSTAEAPPSVLATTPSPSVPAADVRYPSAEERAQWIPIPNAAERKVTQASISPVPAGRVSTASTVALPDGWKRHVVQRQENFWTISRTYYNSGRYYRALWQANREHVPLIDELYIGTELLIPPLKELAPDAISNGAAERDPAVRRRSYEEGPASRPGEPDLGPDGVVQSDYEEPVASAEPAADAPPVRGPARLQNPVHVVQPNETLRSIARTRLGHPDRSDELHRLNEHKIRDPRSIPPGLVLKLPPE